MNLELADRIANTTLYEGYILYPYRPSSVKNRQRFNFGVLTPQPYSEAQRGAESWLMQTECLASGDDRATLDLKARFLQLRERKMDDQDHQIWQEAVEREIGAQGVKLDELVTQSQRLQFSFPGALEREFRRDASGKITGVITRRQEAIDGLVELRAMDCDALAGSTKRLFKITARILNLTLLEDAERASRDEALLRSLVSAHTIIGIRGGEFVSLLDPHEELREIAASCENIGTWPVLVGEESERDCMLSSPIILYDYPQIAPESAGDFFDGTEIDEMLTLRVLTMTDEEKREMAGVDERARRILERTESLPPEQLMKMHGAARGLRRIESQP